MRNTVTWRISIFLTSRKQSVLERPRNAYRVRSTRWFFLNWHIVRIFFVFNPYEKINKFNHTLMLWGQETKIAKITENYVQIFLSLCQLKLFRCLLRYAKKGEIQRAENLENPCWSKLASKIKPSISVASCHSNEIKVLKEASSDRLKLQILDCRY